MDQTPLHLLTEDRRHATGGRLRRTDGGWELFNAYIALRLVDPEGRPVADDLREGALARAVGRRSGTRLEVDELRVVDTPASTADEAPDRTIPLGRTLRARHDLNRRIHGFFEDRDFLEVQTRALTPTPGTDPHLDPVPAEFRQDPTDEDHRRVYLHTSPELQMKRLLAEGAGPIYQLGRVWRNGEVTARHNPEFTLLEWYRPWEDLDAIIEDVERLVGRVLDADSDRPVEPPVDRMTMAEVVRRACGFDIREALDAESLRREIRRRDLLSDRHMETARWEELFYSLNVSHIDPFLEDQGAVAVTDWPRPLAILARESDDDPRVAERFELYVDGVELANGFGELTDPGEQRRRFDADNRTRRRLDLPELPIPEAFLGALRRGMPPSAGVALGVDRLLMLATEGADGLRDVRPFALERNVEGIQWP